MTAWALSNRLTRGARLELGRRSAFRVCGYGGLLAGSALAFAIVASRDGSLAAMGAVATAAVATFLLVALAHLAIAGDERLVYYHHEIAVLAVAAAVAAALHEPPLVYLDATALGIGAFLTCGRVGCFMVGCCHGRPHRWGVRYDAHHADAGFARGLVGVRLFPIQLVEAALAAAIVATGAALVAAGAAAGAAFTWYVAAYAVARFFLEFARGDAERPYRAGFSQPQWLSLACAGAVAAGAAAGVLPWHPWDAAVAVIAVGIGLVVLRRRRRGALRTRALGAAHLQELVAAMRRSAAADRPAVVTTSLGVRVSAGSGHVTLSGVDEPLARDLARYVGGALEPPGRAAVVPGGAGVFHVVASA